MILIADSGSTKTLWCGVNKGNPVFCHTHGINPFYMNQEAIIKILNEEFTIDCREYTTIYFYGAGNTPDKKTTVYNALSHFFSVDNIHVESDLLGAARSLCMDKEGIACILGTGSNSCYYNGKTITQTVSPLGYILGDEGSGAYMGKKLLADVLKNQLSAEIKKEFFKTYLLAESDLLEHVYRKPLPNKFLAQFTQFIAKHIHWYEIENLVYKSFDEFIIRNLLQYPNLTSTPVNFTGSIAYVFAKQLTRQISKNGLIMGMITQNPMEGLIEYHLKYL